MLVNTWIIVIKNSPADKNLILILRKCRGGQKLFFFIKNIHSSNIGLTEYYCNVKMCDKNKS